MPKRSRLNGAFVATRVLTGIPVGLLLSALNSPAQNETAKITIKPVTERPCLLMESKHVERVRAQHNAIPLPDL